jgi:hypothetical protein
MVIVLSAGTLTEPLFALLLTGAVLFYLRGRYYVSALCMSLLPLARLEGVLFLGIWLLLLVRQRQLKAAACLFVFPLLVNVAGFLSTGELLYVWRFNPYGSGGGEPQNWLRYAPLFPAVTGPVLLPLVTVGILGSIRDPARRLVAGVAVVLVVFYFYAYARGVIADPGSAQLFLLRFFVTGAPLFAVLGAVGVHLLLETDRRAAPPPLLLAFAIAQAAAITVWMGAPGSPVGRFHLVAAWLVGATAVGRTMVGRRRVVSVAFVSVALAIGLAFLVRWTPIRADVSPVTETWTEIAAWFRTSEWSERNVVAVHPGFWMAAERDPYVMPHAAGMKVLFELDLADLVRQSPRGTVVIWDSHLFASRGVPEDALRPPQLRLLHAVATSDDPRDPLFSRGQRAFRVAVYEKVQ